MSAAHSLSGATLSAYAQCQALTRRSGSSFAATFWMLPREKRRAVHAIYAFCRLADDIADAPNVRGNRSLLLERWRSELDDAYRGKSRHPIGIALGDAIQRFQLPEEVFGELLDGIEWDLSGGIIESYDELQTYCHRVASTVGLLLVRVFGFRNARSLEYAEVLGIAIQLTNVLRDVGEDAAAGRIYLPRQDLARFNVDPRSLSAGKMSDELRLLLGHYAERARLTFERAEELLPEEDRKALLPAEAMGRIYRVLLRELYERRFPCLEGSLRLSNPRLLGIAAGAWLGLGGRVRARCR